MDIEPSNMPKDVLDSLFDGVYFVDRDRRVVYWNGGAERITGHLRESILGQDCHDALLDYITPNGSSLCKDGCILDKAMKDGTMHEAEVFVQHADGYRVPVMVRVVPLRDAQGRVSGAAEIISNNQALMVDRLRTRRLDETIRIDPLTGIGNHDHILAKLNSAIGEMAQYADRIGILLIDIDRFSEINDRFGRETGDKTLRMVANTLRNGLRASDACGRWGTDEFVVLAYGVDAAGLRIVAQKLQTLAEKAALSLEKGGSLHARVLIGATLVQAGDTAETLVKRAQTLVQQSRGSDTDRITQG